VEYGVLERVVDESVGVDDSARRLRLSPLAISSSISSGYSLLPALSVLPVVRDPYITILPFSSTQTSTYSPTRRPTALLTGAGIVT